MKFIPAIFLIAIQFAHGEVINPDLPLLMNNISTICGGRWIVEIDDSNHIIITSRDKALGEAPGYNFGPGEEYYTLYFRFKIVEAIDNKAEINAMADLKNLREKGNSIKHENMMGHYRYYPKNVEEWTLVLSIKKAESIVEDIPKFKYKSVYLSVQYHMDFFVPNKDNSQAVIYKNDITNLFKILEKVGP